ncbi:MAG: putative beta-lysine N-acetyltransferase [Proteobacteria bacterium]|nr:putative beta-lysine N-acetyltransferase [Pseudomonadota bacterium]MBU1688280.1 putative beta-lysine N-acetyltransferase [Pseudomonadota bacterium]
MADQIIKIGQSTLQHGKENDRVYLMKLMDVDMPDLLEKIDALARSHNYGKIFAKVPTRWLSWFCQAGFNSEALVPYFFDSNEDCHFMARYHDPQRSFEPDQQELIRVITLARQAPTRKRTQLPENYTIRICQPDDSPEMARLLGSVFKSYPFPVYDPAYLIQTMTSDVRYFGAYNTDNQLAALASAEMAPKTSNVEMTDFATAPGHRKKGLSRYLLRRMEENMRERGLAIAYTIARAKSVGMNKTFAYGDYKYGGTLVQNTQICGGLESMNVWYKHLSKKSANKSQTAPIQP